MASGLVCEYPGLSVRVVLELAGVGRERMNSKWGYQGAEEVL
jgi:hypothetical protein